jgi:hypothetical protein
MIPKPKKATRIRNFLLLLKQRHRECFWIRNDVSNVGQAKCSPEQDCGNRMLAIDFVVTLLCLQKGGVDARRLASSGPAVTAVLPLAVKSSLQRLQII